MYTLNTCVVFSIQSNRTALMEAAERGHLEVLSKLLDSGADMDKVSCDGVISSIGLFINSSTIMFMLIFNNLVFLFSLYELQ